MNHKHRFARQIPRSITTCPVCKGGGREVVPVPYKNGEVNNENGRPCHKCRGKGVTEKPY